ncbi:MAG: deaminase, partial [Armatimonadota bacterium]|nr:deaminase [Armatimonadota bacterium]
GTGHDTCLCIHAEQNAILQAAYHGVAIAGATLYCTHQPCLVCAKMIANVGLLRVVYAGDYPDPTAASLLQEAGVELVHYPGPLSALQVPPPVSSS